LVLRRFTAWRSVDTDRRIWPWAIFGPLLLALIVGGFSLTPVGEGLERRIGLWALFRLRGPLPPPEDVIIIAMRRDAGERISILRNPPPDQPCIDLRIDNAPPTHEILGNVPERWGRCHYVELLRRLARARPAITTLDVVFQPRGDRPVAEDRLLAQAIRETGVVVAAQSLRVRKAGTGAAGDGGGDARSDYLVALSRDIASAVTGAAPMPLPKDGSNRIDEFWTFKEYGWATPSLAAVSLQAYALDLYPDFVRGVQALAAPVAADLPPELARRHSRGALQTHMLVVRRVLLGDEALAPMLSRAQWPARGEVLRALTALYLGDVSRHLNLYGPAGSIRTIDITQLLATPVEAFSADPFGVRGKAVFIGYAEDVEWDERETFSTVFDRGAERLSGVEITATAFSNLLHGTDLRAASVTAGLLITFVITSAVALTCYAAGTAGALLMSFILALGYLALAAFLFSHYRFCVPVFIPVAIGWPLAVAYGFGHKYVDFRQDRAALRYILAQLVPSDVVDVFRDNARRLGSLKESVKAACVMTDVEGYTSLSNRMSPSEVSALLSEYFAAIFRPVADHGGFVSDLKGDSILALWTDKGQNESVRVRVCEACLDLQAAVNRFNRGHQTSPLPTRIGVNYGDVVIGTIGAPPHYEYRAVGDAVNTASRVEQLSKDLGTGLLVTAALAEGLDQFLFRPLGEFALRGRRSLTAIYELIARAEDATPEQADLCNGFALALEAYLNGRLSEARARFEGVRVKQPDDGPTLYYLRLLGQVQ
jgi:adenylate cyclase